MHAEVLDQQMLQSLKVHIFFSVRRNIILKIWSEQTEIPYFQEHLSYLNVRFEQKYCVSNLLTKN